jgi:hypothetical protein
LNSDVCCNDRRLLGSINARQSLLSQYGPRVATLLSVRTGGMDGLHLVAPLDLWRVYIAVGSAVEVAGVVIGRSRKGSVRRA